MNKNMYFIKLGGSLITDKRKQEISRPQIIKDIAQEIKEFLDVTTNIDLLIGHGSGSFGHWEAQKHNTRAGVITPLEWHGFARVSAAASRLNRLVVDTFLKVGVTVFSMQPSASIEANTGTILEYNTQNIRTCLNHNLVPVIFGDVAFDRARGGTIFSTEDLFAYLTPIFKPTRIILLGNARGVYDNHKHTISNITPQNYPEIIKHLHGSKYTDVTGGMADKVKHMVALVESNPDLKIHIISGRKSGTLRKTLLDSSYNAGTIISHA